MTQQTRENIIPILRDYFSTQPVEKVWLFGSFARGEEREDSDMDILFLPIDKEKFSIFTQGGMYMDLRELLGREVDLVEDGTLLPFAVKSANADKILVYERAN